MLKVMGRSIKLSSLNVLWNDLKMSLEKSDGFFFYQFSTDSANVNVSKNPSSLEAKRMS